MLKTSGFIMLAVFAIVMFNAPARNFMNNLLQKDKTELKEEQIIGTVSGHNPRVEEIQKILKDAGIEFGPIDGVMGSQTRSAIRKFQKAKGLKLTGKIDPVTQLALNRMKEVERPSLKVEVESGLWEVSDKPKQIQIALKSAGFFKGEIDGKIGPQTKTSIRAFQKANNLNPDGVAGSKTWDALKKYLKN